MTTYKDFGEVAEIEYKLTVTVNDDVAIEVTSFSEGSLLEQLHKVDNAIADKISEQYEELKEV